jgi:hypothetical protein
MALPGPLSNVVSEGALSGDDGYFADDLSYYDAEQTYL